MDEHESMPDETNSLAEWLAKQSPDLQCVRIKTGPCPACSHPLAIWTIARCLDAAPALRILAKSAAIHAFVIIPDDDAGIARVHKVYPTEAVWEMTQPHQFARMIGGLLEHHQCPQSDDPTPAWAAPTHLSDDITPARPVNQQPASGCLRGLPPGTDNQHSDGR